MDLIIALDRKASECTEPGLIQLRTPLTGYAKGENQRWVMDNGAYSNFYEHRFLRMAMDGMFDLNCEWIAMPDVVGNHQETLELFNTWTARLGASYIPLRDHYKKWAFVIQDGATIETIPWDEIVAVFLGGTTRFKMSREAYRILQHARAIGKWVHVGRVNTEGRISYFYGVADSIDGSGIARYDYMLTRAQIVIRSLQNTRQKYLEEYN